MKPWLRDKLLAEWRGLPQTVPPPDRAKFVTGELDKLLSTLGLLDRVDEAEIIEEWKSIVGDFIAAHSKPQSLKEGCLSIRVSQPTVRYELERIWKPRILENLQNRFGKKKIRSLRFQL